MTKETSAELATIAGRVLAQGRAVEDIDQYVTDALKLAGSALSQREVIQAQVDGEDIFELTPKHEIPPGRIGNFTVTENTLGGLTIVPVIEETDAETNFGFYLDGYTLASTDIVGQVKITDYAGTSVIIKSKALTDFFERRLRPGNPEEE